MSNIYATHLVDFGDTIQRGDVRPRHIHGKIVFALHNKMQDEGGGYRTSTGIQSVATTLEVYGFNGVRFYNKLSYWESDPAFTELEGLCDVLTRFYNAYKNEIDWSPTFTL